MSPQKIQRVIAAGSGGLSNRLKTVVSAWRMADAMGVEPLLYWPITKKVPVAFRELFSCGLNEIDEPEFQRLARDPSANVVLDGWRFVLMPSDVVERRIKRPYAPRDRRAIDFAYNETPDALLRDFSRYVDRIQPVQRLAERIEVNAKEFGPQSVAVHLRTWCFMGDDRPVYYSFENYLAALKQHAGKLIFVASDSQEAIESLRRAQIGDVRSMPVSARGHYTQEQIEDAVCELFLLARPPVLIAAFASTFSEYAWWIGKCRQAVSVAKPRTYFFKFQSRHAYCLGWEWTLRDTG